MAGHVLGAAGPHADCHELLPGVNAEDDDIDAADSSSSIRVVKNTTLVVQHCGVDFKHCPMQAMSE